MTLNNETFESSIVMSSGELIALLNSLYLKSKTDFKVIDCLYGLKLIDVEISDEIRIKLMTSLQNLQSEYNRLPHTINSEFPDKLDYFNVFVYAGLFFDRHKHHFKKIFEEIKNRDYLKGEHPIAIAFDTNLYYEQMFSHLSRYIRLKYDNFGHPLNFLISEGVRKELMNYEDKYNRRDLEELKNYANYPQIVEQFNNQNKFFARKKHLAHIDFLKNSIAPFSKEVKEDSTYPSEDMDTKIIMGLINEARSQEIKLYLFSQDSNFFGRTRSIKNLEGIFLEKNRFRYLDFKFNCSWELFCRLIYYFAIIFGAIILKFQNGSQMVIHGIWKGKRVEDWEAENVKIFASKAFTDDFGKDIFILNNLKEEGFEF